MITNIGKHYFYRHIRLDTKEPFYIGIGTKLKSDSKSSNYYCIYRRGFSLDRRNNLWKKIANKADYEVEILLESDDYEFIKQKEIEFIALYGRINTNNGILANMTDGGDGTLGVIISEETIINMKAERKKRHAHLKEERLGEKFKTKTGELTIIDYICSDNVTIQFDDGTILENIKYRCIVRGEVRNMNFPTVKNIGFIGYGKYKTVDEEQKRSKEYSCWIKILKKCNKLDKSTTICNEWKNFQNFAKWFEDNYIEGWCINNTIINKNNSEYSPKTCCFLPRDIINFFTYIFKNSELPTGILKTYNNKFQVRLFLTKNKKNFNTLEEALTAYYFDREQFRMKLIDKYKKEISIELYKKIINYELY